MADSVVSEGEFRVYQQILSLQLSWNCNAACRQCMVVGREHRSRTMTSAEGRGLIDQLEHMPLTRFVGFTGGEPFLSYELLLELGRYLHEKFGYGFGVATNCFWAQDRANAERMLRPLVEVGLAELLVSLDDFHLEFVDGTRIEHAVWAALDLGVDITIQTIRTRTGHDPTWFQEHMNIPRPPRVRWVETPCHPAGRAVSQVPKSEYIYDWENQAGHCTALRVWNIDPYGWVTPCCGTGFSAALRTGNAFREDLAEIAHRANVDPLLNTIAAWGGPYLLIKTLEQRGDFRYSNRLFASHCHACDTVLRDLKALQVLAVDLPPHWLEAVASRLTTQMLWYRSFVLKDNKSNWLLAGWLGDASSVPVSSAGRRDGANAPSSA